MNPEDEEWRGSFQLDINFKDYVLSVEFKFGVWSWKSNLKFEFEGWSQIFKLKFRVEVSTWSLKLKFQFELSC